MIDFVKKKIILKKAQLNTFLQQRSKRGAIGLILGERHYFLHVCIKDYVENAIFVYKTR